jgi:hypothetical protein
MAVRSSPDIRRRACLRAATAVAALLSLSACDSLFKASPEDRMGYLRELVRARMVARDSLPIDGCSVDRFMAGLPAWRDSLVAAERSRIADATAPCPTDVRAVPGRFVITRWYRNWTGEYVIRGTVYPWDEGYRFADGIFVGREQLSSNEFYTGIAEPARVKETPDSAIASSVKELDSTRRAGMLADTMLDTLMRDSSRIR